MLGSLEGILLPRFDSGRFSRRGCAFIESATLYCISAEGIQGGGDDSEDNLQRDCNCKVCLCLAACILRPCAFSP